MRADEDGPIKIGWSKNSVTRAREIKPNDVAYLTIVRLIDGPSWIERWFHRRFSPSRLDGEWFTFDSDMLVVEPPADRPADLPKGHVPVMKDIHLWLPDDEAERFASVAKAEDRSLTNMVRTLAREGLAARETKKPAAIQREVS